MSAESIRKRAADLGWDVPAFSAAVEKVTGSRPGVRDWSGVSLGLIGNLMEGLTGQEVLIYATANHAFNATQVIRNQEPPRGALLWFNRSVDGDVAIHLGGGLALVVGKRVENGDVYPVPGLLNVFIIDTRSVTWEVVYGHPIGWSAGIGKSQVTLVSGENLPGTRSPLADMTILDAIEDALLDAEGPDYTRKSAAESVIHALVAGDITLGDLRLVKAALDRRDHGVKP